MQPSVEADLLEMAQRVIETNRYMTLGTLEPDGTPRLSPVRFVADGMQDLYWASARLAQHSRNLALRPAIQVVIYNSAAENDEGEGVYLGATASEVPSDSIESTLARLAVRRGSAQGPVPTDFRGESPMRLYHAEVLSCEVHVSRSHPTLGTGVDLRRSVQLPSR